MPILQVVLVLFLGGYTLAEVAAFRWAQLLGYFLTRTDQYSI